MIGNTGGMAYAISRYLEREERLREDCDGMSRNYLQGRIDQYNESAIPNIPLVGRFFEPHEIRVMKSVLEEKNKK